MNLGLGQVEGFGMSKPMLASLRESSGRRTLRPVLRWLQPFTRDGVGLRLSWPRKHRTVRWPRLVALDFTHARSD